MYVSTLKFAFLELLVSFLDFPKLIYLFTFPVSLVCNWHVMLYKFKVCNSMISCMYILQSDHHKLGLKSYCLKFTEFQFSGLSTSVFSLKGKISCFVLFWFVWETREQFCGLKQSPEARLPPIWYLPRTLESSDHSQSLHYELPSETEVD